MKVSTRPHVVKVRVSEDEREFLERVAAEDDRTISNVLRLALKEFYERRMEAAA
jgi:predicted transcriptional regulator